MSGEEDTIKIVDFTLVPVGSIKEGGDAWNRGCLVCIRLDSDARVVAHREQVVDDLEALVASGIIGRSDGADL